MKRFWLAFSILFFSGLVYATPSVLRSSSTATADTTQVLCGQKSRGFFKSVIVSSAVAGTDLRVYNSSFTTTSQNTGTIMTSSLGTYNFDAGYPSGIMYTKTGTAQITIMYDCY